MTPLDKALGKHKGKLVGYVRVSTLDQNTERQLDGIKLDRLFTDKASGKDANRPALLQCMDYLREDDTLMVHSMDRLARNVEDMLHLVGVLTNKGVTIIFVKENLAFSGEASPMNKLMLTLLAAFAEFERNLIRERQREGIAIAKSKGIYKGRKHGLSGPELARLYALLDAGKSKAEVARAMQIARSTVYDYIALRKESDDQ